MLTIWLRTIFGFRSYHQLQTLGPWRMAFFALYLWLVGVLVFNFYCIWQIHQKLPAFIQAVPAITFEQGRFVSPNEKTAVSIPGTDYQIILDKSATHIPSQQDFVAQRIVAFVTEKMIYLPGMTGVNAQPIPAQLQGEINAQWLNRQAPALRGLLQLMVGVGSVIALSLFGIFSVLLAGAIIYFWRGMTRVTLPSGTLWKWAVLLQGPALVLWLIHLVWGVPLFVFALFILFNIYVQQIFNTLPDQGGNHVA